MEQPPRYFFDSKEIQEPFEKEIQEENRLSEEYLEATRRYETLINHSHMLRQEILNAQHKHDDLDSYDDAGAERAELQKTIDLHTQTLQAETEELARLYNIMQTHEHLYDKDVKDQLDRDIRDTGTHTTDFRLN